MTKEFDARNENKSRSVCAAMAESADTDKRVLSEKERRILDMWPRFEDTGDPVMVGDAYIDGSGDCNIIVAVRICDACVDLVGEDAFLTGFKPGERVKRPVQSVLDADGVEIKVGDTVWTLDGLEGVVTKVENGAAYIAYESDYAQREEADNLTHTRPDSWERLEEDAEKNPFDYCKDVGHRLDTCENSEAYKARDIVRRAKKLVGVER